MESSLARYIWKYSRRQQFLVVALTFASFPILYLTLQIPKWIINDALGDSTGQKTLLGISFDPIPYLIALCFSLLALIVINGLLKMRINTYKGIIGERLVRRMRYTLLKNILRFPLPYFSRISSGELISTVTAETEPLGGYIGESYALPLFQGGTMITILIFMFAQDFVFGLVSVALIPIQGYIIPKLQHQVNLLKKERVRHVRKLSERIGETVSGATEIRLHGTQPYTLAEFSKRLGDLFLIRLEIFKKKFFMKFLNNTIGQITPFLFYLFGGYLVIKGDLTLGALVAAIAAYKDLTSPWRELLNFYQLHEDSKIKFQQIRELFFPEDLVDINEVETEQAPIPLAGDIQMVNVSWRNENGEQVLSGIDLTIKQGATIAITGDYAIRRSRLAQLLCALERPSSGTIRVGDQELYDIPDSILRRRLAFQGPDPHLFAGSISENIEYGLQQREPAVPEGNDSQSAEKEAKSSGNRSPIDSGWLDYSQARLKDGEEPEDWYQRGMKAVGSDEIVYTRSLLERFDPEQKPDLAARLIEARHIIRDELAKIEGEEVIVTPFDPDTFNASASVSENILYGIPADDRLDTSTFLVHEYFIEILAREHLTDTAIDIGLLVAKTLLERVDNNTISQDSRSHFGLEEEERIDRIRYTVDNYISHEKLSRPCYCLLLAQFLLIIPDRHRFVQINARLATRLLQARREFKEHFPEELNGAVEYFDESRYHSKLTVIDNLLFGRVSSRNPYSERIVKNLVRRVIEENDLRKPLNMLLGESQVGISGSRLPLAAKHNITLGRALIKNPDILVMHDALAPFDPAYQAARRHDIRKLLPDATIIWIARDIANPAEFDQLAVLTERGEVIEVDQHGEPLSDHPTGLEDPDKTAGHRSSNALELIANSILFSELSPSQQRYLADHSAMVSMIKGTQLYQPGDDADSVWLVVSGEVGTHSKDHDIIGQFKRPEVFGAIEVIADTSRLLTAIVSEDAMLLRIDAGAIETVAMSDAQVSRTLLRSLTHQWRT